MARILLISILITGFLLLSCNRNKKEIIPEDKFVEVAVDMHMLDAMLNNHYIRNQLSEKDAGIYYYSVFQKHGVTQEQFENTVKYYVDHIKKYKSVYAEVTKRLSQMETRYKQ